MNDRVKGTLCALFANVIFGFSFLFSARALAVADVYVLLTLRFAAALLSVGLLALCGIIRMDFKGKKTGKLFLLGLMQPFLYFICEQYGILHTSSAFSGVMIALVPVCVMIFAALFLKEKTTVKQAAFGTLSLLAVVYVSVSSGKSGKADLTGVLLLVGAVVTASVYNLLSRSLSDSFTPWEKTFAMFAEGFVGFFLLGAIRLKGDFFPLMGKALERSDFLIATGYLAVVSSTVAFGLYNTATSLIPAAKSAAFSNVVTVVSVLAGVCIQKEPMTVWEAVACLVIVIGVWGVNRQK